jgi:hypothetical protein
MTEPLKSIGQPLVLAIRGLSSIAPKNAMNIVDLIKNNINKDKNEERAI